VLSPAAHITFSPTYGPFTAFSRSLIHNFTRFVPGITKPDIFDETFLNLRHPIKYLKDEVDEHRSSPALPFTWTRAGPRASRYVSEALRLQGRS
jgi:hypothetical protein